MSSYLTPVARLAVRAILSGVSVLVAQVSAADNPLDKGLWVGAIVASGWAALEAFTPLNQLVGWFKENKDQ